MANVFDELEQDSPAAAPNVFDELDAAPPEAAPVANVFDALEAEVPAPAPAAQGRDKAHAARREHIRVLMEAPDDAAKNAELLKLSREYGANTRLLRDPKFYDYLKGKYESAGRDPDTFLRENNNLAVLGLEIDPFRAKTLWKDPGVTPLTKGLHYFGAVIEQAGNVVKALTTTSENADESALESLAKLPALEELLPKYEPGEHVQADVGGNPVTAPLKALGQGFMQGLKQTRYSHLGAKLAARDALGLDTSELQLDLEDAKRELTPRYYEDGLTRTLASIGTGTASSLPSLLPTLAATGVSLASRGRVPLSMAGKLGAAGAALFNYEITLGSSYADTRDAKDFHKQPLSKLERLGAAHIDASITAALEGLSLGITLKALGPLGKRLLSGEAVKEALLQPGFMAIARRAGQAWATSAAGEGGTEALQEVASDGVRFLLANRLDIANTVENAGAFDVRGTGYGALTAGAAGVEGSLLIGALAGGINVAQAKREQGRVLKNAQQLKSVLKMAETPAAAGMPDVVAELVRREFADEGEHVTAAHIDPKAIVALFQGNEADAMAAAEEIFGAEGPARLQEALRTDTHLEVPMELYLSKVGNRPLGKQLERDTALRAGAKTLNEMERDAKADAQAARELADELVKNDTAPESDAEARLVEAVEAQLRATGKYSKAAAADAAALYRAIARTQHAEFQKSGSAATLDELFGMYTLRIRGETPDGASTPANTALAQSPREEAAPATDAARLRAAVAGTKGAARAERGFRDPVSGLLAPRAWKLRPRTPGAFVASITSPELKGLNDDVETGGHDLGNDFLREMAIIAAESDIQASRIGTGVVLEVADAAGLEAVLARLREALPGYNFVGGLSEDTTEAKLRREATEDDLSRNKKIPERGKLPPGIVVSEQRFERKPLTTPLPDYAVAAAAALDDEALASEVFLDKDSKGVETGLYSAEGLKALEDADPSDFTLALDVGGLKKLNDKHGKAAGDALLREFARVVVKLGGVGLRATHRSGDEYSLGSNDEAQLEAFAAQLREALQAERFAFVSKDGKHYSTHIEFRDGVGETYGRADKALNRKRAGLQPKPDSDVAGGPPRETGDGGDSGRDAAGGRGRVRTQRQLTPGLQAGEERQPSGAVKTLFQGPKAPAKRGPFARWFGESKVVTKTGRPLVMYHGTNYSGFDVFEKKYQDATGLFGPGFYFTADPEVAGSYTDKQANTIAQKGEAPGVYPVVLRIERPVDIDAKALDLIPQLMAYRAPAAPTPLAKRIIDGALRGGSTAFSMDGIGAWADNDYETYKQLDAAGLSGEEALAEAFPYILEKARDYIVKGIRSREFMRGEDVVKFIENNVFRRLEGNGANIQEVLKAYGFDGITHVGGDRMGGGAKHHQVWIAFEPTQIKSATGNSGAFDAEVESILKQPAWHGSPHHFDRFTTGKIGTGEGAQAYGWGLYFAQNRKVAESYRKNLTKEAKSRAREPIEAALKALDFLGFDRASQAVSAVLTHGDWEKRWDITPEQAAPLREAIANYRERERRSGLRVDGKKGRELGGEWIQAAFSVMEGRLLERPTDVEGAIKHSLDLLAQDRETAAKEAERERKLGREPSSENDVAGIDEALAWVKTLTPERLEAPDVGQLYSVEVPDDDVLLDHGAPLNLQPEGVQQKLIASGLLPDALRDHLEGKSTSVTEIKLGGFYNPVNILDVTGDHLYRHLERTLGSDKAASLALNEAGIPGLRYLDRESRGDGEGTHNFVIWNDDAVRMLETLFQDEKDANADPRGYVEMARDGLKRIFSIVLNPRADMSTFLHESGHVFLEIMADLAERPDAPERLKNDWKKTQAYLGIVGRPTLSTPEGVAAHEKWARSFEAYLLEGVAPSPELARPFERFKTWLKRLYRSIASLDVPMGDDIRGVFDRLLASDAEIEKAKGRLGMSPRMFKGPDDFGGTPAEYAAYLEAEERATSSATKRLDRRMLKDRLQALESWWREEHEALRDVFEAQHDAMPASVALELIRGRTRTDAAGVVTRDRPVRLDRAAVKRLLGERFDTFPRNHLKKGGVHPDEVAKAAGLTSGAEMLDAILSLPPKSEWAEMMADLEMRTRHPDVLENKTALAAEADKALHGDATAGLLFKELAALKRKAEDGGPAAVEVMKEAARLTIEATRLRELNPTKYLQAEGSASNKALKAAAQGNWPQAYVYKQQQLLNHFLYREALKARDARDAFEGLAKKMASARRRGELGKAGRVFRNASDAVLFALGLGENHLAGATLTDAKGNPIAPEASIRALADVMRRQDVEPVFDDIALERLLHAPRDWRTLTAGEMDNVERALKQTWRVAKDANLATFRGQRIQVEDLKRKMEEEVSRRPPAKLLPRDPNKKPTRWEEYRRRGLAREAEKLEPSVIIDRIGPTATGFFFDGAMDAREAETQLAGIVLSRFNEALAKMPKTMQASLHDVVPGAAEALPLPEDVISRDETDDVSRKYLLMIALNMGNESNKDRLLGGYRWTEEQVMGVLDAHMTEEEWGFVRKLWSILDETLYPEVAKTFEAVNGVSPKKIKPSVLRTRFGEFTGGYVPAKYDPVSSRLGERDAAAEYEALMSNGGVRASVAKGFTKDRAKVYVDVINLDWNILQGHIAKTIHYAAYDRFVRDASRVLMNPRMKTALDRHLGEDQREQLEKWLKVTANAGSVSLADDAKGHTEQLAAIKGALTAGALGLSFANAAGDSTNPLVAAASGRVKWPILLSTYLEAISRTVLNAPQVPGAALRAVRGEDAGFTGGFVQMRKEALAKSRILRMQTSDARRDLKKALDETGKNDGPVETKLQWLRDHQYVFQETVAKLTSTATWTAAYRQALAEGQGEKDAIRHADKMLSDVSVSFEPADVSTFLRDKRTTGVLYGFQSWFQKLHNLCARVEDPFWVAWGNAEGFSEHYQALPYGARAASQVLAMYFVSSVLGNLAMGKQKEEDEDWAEYMLRTALSAPWSTHPLFAGPGEAVSNAVVSYFYNGKVKHRRLNMRAAPSSALIEKVAKRAYNITKGERRTSELAFDALEIGLTAARLPASPPRRGAEYLYNYISGRYSDDNPAEAAFHTAFGDKRK